MINASNGRIYAPVSVISMRRWSPSIVCSHAPPLPAEGFLLAPGSRIDVDLVAPDQPGSYTVSDDFTGDVLALAAIDVSGEPVATPDFASPGDPDLTVWGRAAEVAIDREHTLNIRRADHRWQNMQQPG